VNIALETRAHAYNRDVVCAIAGCTYQQLDHWRRRGYIKSLGNDRWFDEQEAAVITVMTRLIHAGLLPTKASEVARRIAEQNVPVRPRPPVRVERTEQPVGDQSYITGPDTVENVRHRLYVLHAEFYGENA